MPRECLCPKCEALGHVITSDVKSKPARFYYRCSGDGCGHSWVQLKK